MDEKLCVQKILSGNTSAFAYFVDTYQDMAITIAYRICNNMQDAEDVVQESYIRAYRNLHTFRGQSKFSTWFYRIVYNTAVNQSRLKIWTPDTPEDRNITNIISEDEPEKKLEELEKQEIVAEALQKLPKGDALLLTLYYMEENSIKEIAEITGLNASNVKVRLFRARNTFRESISTHFEIYENYTH